MDKPQNLLSNSQSCKYILKVLEKQMIGNLDEKAVKEALKKIVDNNDTIPYKVKAQLKAIIELEHNPEKLL